MQEGCDGMPGDRRRTSIEWPAIVDARLRHLVQLAEERTEVQITSASELLAALIWAQPLDASRLAATIIAYRRAERETMGMDIVGDLGPPRVPRRGRPRRDQITSELRPGRLRP